jgi:GTP:adenosylcobinamide-phosphate guanylyltransferase
VPAEGPRSFTAIILAAQRDGKLDPLAERAGVTHKSLAPILGRPLLNYVLDALMAVPGLSRIRICIEPQAVEAVRAITDAVTGMPVDFVAAKSTITESAYASAEGVAEPMVITTADNVNLTPGAIQQMVHAIAQGADAAVALATKGAVLAAHPEGQRRFYQFSEDAYSNCNLYALSGPRGLRAAETFREGGQFAKNPKRLIRAFGLLNVLLVRYKLVSLEGAMKRASKRFGFRIDPVVLADGAHAIDVDNARTYDIAEIILKEKAAARG